MPADKKNIEEKRDRLLGDEWKDWDGALSAEAGTINESKRTFFIFSSFFIFMVVIGSLFFLYLITPRLEMIGTHLRIAVSVIFIAGVAAVLTWHISLILAVSGKKVFSFSKGINKRILIFIIDKTAKLGCRFGVSKDRMSNSFLKVLNMITERDSRYLLPLRPLLVLPRCLTKELKEKTEELSRKYAIEHFVVGGGQAALAILKKKNPKAVIGVACERDLISGIKEVKADIPVIAISNRRPHGPCKDTDIDIEELERAIKYFLQI